MSSSRTSLTVRVLSSATLNLWETWPSLMCVWETPLMCVWETWPARMSVWDPSTLQKTSGGGRPSAEQGKVAVSPGSRARSLGVFVNFGGATIYAKNKLIFINNELMLCKMLNLGSNWLLKWFEILKQIVKCSFSARTFSVRYSVRYSKPL